MFEGIMRGMIMSTSHTIKHILPIISELRTPKLYTNGVAIRSEMKPIERNELARFKSPRLKNPFDSRADSYILDVEL